MYQVTKLHTALIAGLCLSLLISCAWASVISVPELTFQSGGDVVTSDILLDSAPNGISGYNITLSLADPELGQITAVSFPEWAGLKGNSPLPSSFVVIRAVDTGNLVERNITGILLAKVSVTSKKAGSTSLLISVNQLDDDTGNPVMETVPVIHEETTSSEPSTTATSAANTLTQSGGGSGTSNTGTGSSSGSGTGSPVRTVSVTLFIPAQDSGSPENVTESGSSATSRASTSSSDTQAVPTEPSRTKAPLMVWGIVCALFCACIIIRYKKST